MCDDYSPVCASHIFLSLKGAVLHVSLVEGFCPSSELLYIVSLAAKPAFLISLQLIVNLTNFPCTFVPLLN